MSTEKKETVTLSKEQFNAILNELSSLKDQVKELSSRPMPSSKPPVFYSGGNPSMTKELLQSEKREVILSGEKMQEAVDAAIKDYERNPPRRI